MSAFFSVVRHPLCVVLGLFLFGCAPLGFKVDGNTSFITKLEEDGVYQLGGCVYHPGKFHLSHGQTITLSEALKKAGGTINGNYFKGERAAMLTDICILRVRDGSLFEFKLNLRKGDGNFIVQPGDVIYVPELV